MISRKLSIVILLLISTLIISINTSSAEDLVWNPSISEVDGYRVYYGTSSGNYLFSENVGNVTFYSLDSLNLTSGTTYYFVIRAYNV